MIDAHARANAAEHVALFVVAVDRDDQHDRSADRFFGRIAEHPLGGAIPRRNRSVEIHADDRVVAPFNDGSEVEGGQLVAGMHDSWRGPDALPIVTDGEAPSEWVHDADILASRLLSLGIGTASVPP